MSLLLVINSIWRSLIIAVSKSINSLLLLTINHLHIILRSSNIWTFIYSLVVINSLHGNWINSFIASCNCTYTMDKSKTLTLSCAKRRFLNFPFITEFVDGYIRQEGGGGSKQKLGWVIPGSVTSRFAWVKFKMAPNGRSRRGWWRCRISLGYSTPIV